MKLYVIEYIGDVDSSIEGITNNPELWLRQHNAYRVADGEMPELEDDFNFLEFDYQERTQSNTDDYSLYMCNDCHVLVPVVHTRDGDDYCDMCI
jgi:hypothetical protein